MSAIMVRLIPSHRIYVEPFCGGAAVFFRKKRSLKEVLNDLDPNTAFVYRFIRDHTTLQRKALLSKDWTLSESRFQALIQTDPEDLVDRFYRFLYLALGSRNYERLVFNSDCEGMRVEVLKYLPRWQRRLRRVEILSMDYSAVLEKYDSSDTLFYIDPPYQQVDWKLPCPFDGGDWEKLIKRIQQLKAKVLLSAPEDIATLPSHWDRCLIRILNRTAVESQPKYSEAQEWLFANYPLPEIKR